jgi:hypothetical protein
MVRTTVVRSHDVEGTGVRSALFQTTSRFFELLPAYTNTDAVRKAVAASLAQHVAGAVVAAEVAKRAACAARKHTHLTGAARTRVALFAEAGLYAARRSVCSDERAREAVLARGVVEQRAWCRWRTNGNLNGRCIHDVFGDRTKRAVGARSASFAVATAIGSTHADIGTHTHAAK